MRRLPLAQSGFLFIVGPMPKRPPFPASPGRTNAHDRALERASLALRMQRPGEAERIAAEVLKANRGSLRAAQVLGQALLMQNRGAEAIAPLEKAARRSQDPAVETLLGAAFALTGRIDEALGQLGRATARRPPYPPAFLEHGIQLARAGRFAEAIAALESGLAFAPDAVDMQRELAALHLKRNDRGMAREILLQALKVAPDRTDLLSALAQVMLLDGEYAAAAETFRRVVALRPDDAVARAELGRCLLELGQREAGETSIRIATRERPELFGRAIMSLAISARGRFFLRPSAAAKFLRG
ncbi:tetratricopeptide repeat protein [Bradyrhizobium sp.]|uniref:tetratricopeptide repeat protein n=1 Tax=Bradyrhizobium sp. TaxID=376 RepID=UPI0025BF92DA|nr:tetratricopeptide repeat protein [Bradyrhizobium sp.]